ncbi:MAG: hypothetical protein AW07_02809 [Candidatus Accumulibacter sp. SK-11]|nr:MAG: hypothetical protein AW07_02809 [Candidatus Accumulibacter sp. SK-11]
MQRLALEPAAQDLGAVAARPLGDVGEIDPAIVTEAGMQRDVEQSSLANRRHGGQPANGLWIEPAAGVDQPQASGTFADQHPAVGQEGESPRMFESFADDAQPETLPLAVEDLRRGSERPAPGEQQKDGGKQLRPAADRSRRLWQETFRHLFSLSRTEIVVSRQRLQRQVSGTDRRASSPVESAAAWRVSDPCSRPRPSPRRASRCAGGSASNPHRQPPP